MIPEQCKDKIRAMSQQDNIREGFVELFTAVSNDADICNLPAGTLVIPMYDEDDNLQPGDWAPELHFVVRRVE